MDWKVRKDLDWQKQHLASVATTTNHFVFLSWGQLLVNFACFVLMCRHKCSMDLEAKIRQCFGFKKDLLVGKSVQLTSVRPNRWKGCSCTCLFAYCQSCEEHCPFKRRFVLTPQAVVEEQEGQHIGGQSRRFIRKQQQAIKERLAGEEGAPSRLRLRELQPGRVAEELVPTAKQIGRFRSERLFQLRMQQIGTQTEMKELLVTYHPSSEKPAGALGCNPLCLTVSIHAWSVNRRVMDSELRIADLGHACPWFVEVTLGNSFLFKLDYLLHTQGSVLLTQLVLTLWDLSHFFLSHRTDNSARWWWYPWSTDLG